MNYPYARIRFSVTSCVSPKYKMVIFSALSHQDLWSVTYVRMSLVYFLKINLQEYHYELTARGRIKIRCRDGL
jgi:hypothetical protein